MIYLPNTCLIYQLKFCMRCLPNIRERNQPYICVMYPLIICVKYQPNICVRYLPNICVRYQSNICVSYQTNICVRYQRNQSSIPHTVGGGQEGGRVANM